ncbi:hypothetical protein IMSAGC009_01254 [Lachnospiraceae bacterium]|nr:hypothetical protein IMSAGC009_01254 [Lachnospiraceae bacterium]
MLLLSEKMKIEKLIFLFIKLKIDRRIIFVHIKER